MVLQIARTKSMDFDAVDDCKGEQSIAFDFVERRKLNVFEKANVLPPKLDFACLLTVNSLSLSSL
jgi:hypothetical protein